MENQKENIQEKTQEICIDEEEIEKNPHKITYVSALYKLYDETDEPYGHKNKEWRISHFRHLAKTGIRIVVYACSEMEQTVKLLAEEYPENVRFISLKTRYEETNLYKLCMKKKEDGRPAMNLPCHRNTKKDTHEYITLMNGKMDFLRDAIEQNVFQTPFFAWMDFSMAYLFKDKENTPKKMWDLSKDIDLNYNGMMIPGCWEKIPTNYYIMVKDNICWRFCGTFFMGDAGSIMELYKYYVEHLPRFIKETNILTWEINMWAWLEANTEWKPHWYSSDHNDRLIDVPAFVFSF